MLNPSLRIHVLSFVFAVSAGTALHAEHPADTEVVAFLKTNCQNCHEGENAEAGLDLAKIGCNLSEPAQLAKWIRIYDRVHTGEMPPPDAGELSAQDRSQFLTSTERWLKDHQRQDWQSKGRVRGRRLTNLQLERTLHDLLGIDIPLASLLPEESKTNGFTTVADGQSLSHFQLEQHLGVVDAALDEAIRRASSPPDEAEWTLTPKQLARQRTRLRNREPELIDNLAVVWSSRLIFYGRLPSTTARQSGWYRFTVTASALNSPPDHGVWCTVRTGKCVSSAPLLGWVGAFEATGEPQSFMYEAWIPKGEMLEIRPGDDTLKMARFQGGQVGTGEGGPQNVPGIALQEMTMQRIHKGPSNAEIRARLFCDLQLRSKNGKPELVSASPTEAIVPLMLQFAERAFRRPISEEDVTPYVALVQDSLEGGSSLLDALRGGYRALLCSPRFMYFYENPGRLDDYALASRSGRLRHLGQLGKYGEVLFSGLTSYW